jgi:hypothetical protein
VALHRGALVDSAAESIADAPQSTWNKLHVHGVLGRDFIPPMRISTAFH